MMILLFSVQLGWLPASGYVSPFEDWRGNLAAMIMPAFVLGNAIAAVLMRHTRSAMLQVLSSDYVRTARAKGLDERVVVLKHALRNALTPIITLGALELGTLLSGAVLTEQVFTIPGLRQADRRRGVQPRLRGGAGRRAVHRDRVHHAQPAGRHRLLPRQPEAARLDHGDRLPSMSFRARRVPAAARSRAFRGGAPRWSGLVVVVFFIALAVFAPFIAPYDPLQTSWSAIRKAPSAAHWFGTDEIGRDVLSRVIYGARASLAGRPRVGVHLAVVRRADRAARGLRRAAGPTR